MQCESVRHYERGVFTTVDGSRRARCSEQATSSIQLRTRWRPQAVSPRSGNACVQWLQILSAHIIRSIYVLHHYFQKTANSGASADEDDAVDAVGSAFDSSDEPIFIHNLHSLTDADVVVALITPSTSVGYQIGVAQCLGKRILALHKVRSHDNGSFKGMPASTATTPSGAGESLSAMLSGNRCVRALC